MGSVTLRRVTAAVGLLVLVAACQPAPAQLPPTSGASPAAAAKPAVSAPSPIASPAAARPAPAPSPVASAAASPSAVAAARPTVDASLAPTWQGKTLTFVVGSQPGGGYDTWARVIGRHLGNRLPGKPTVVVENRPGGSHRIAMNYLYEAKPDGLTVGLVDRGVLTFALQGDENARYDITKVSWLGSPTTSTQVLVVHQRAGIKSLDQLKTQELRLAMTGAGGSPHTNMILLKELGKYQLKPVFGYGGTSGWMLAIERGEIDASISDFEAFISRRPDEMNSGQWLPLVQFGRRIDHPLLTKVPTLGEVIASPSPEDAQLIQLVLRPFEFGRLLLAPPGMPPNILSTLRAAFLDMYQDPEFMADAQKSGLTIQPMAGEDMQRQIGEFSQIPKSTVKRLEALIEANSEGA